VPIPIFKKSQELFNAVHEAILLVDASTLINNAEAEFQN